MVVVLIVGGAFICGVVAVLRYSCRQAQTAKRLQAITLSSIGDGVIAADATGAVTFMNPEAERLTGWTAAEALAQPLAAVVQVVPEDTGVRAEDPATLVLRTGRQQALSNHTVLIGRDGRRTPIENKASPIQDAGGPVEGAVLVFRDCTRIRQVEEALHERMRAEEALHLSEERFREIAENIREVFWLTDPAKDEIVYVSPAYEAIWGRSAASLHESPRQWTDAVHPDDRERVVRASISRQRTGEYEEEYRIVRPDGTERWIRDRSFPVCDRAGNVIRIAGVAEDITERHELEAELRQAQKMESVGLLAGGVAHDFNNALTVIMSATDVLADEMPPNAGFAEILDEIRSATDRAVSLTRQLLAFSRKEVISPHVLDFNALIGETERMLRRLLGEDVELIASLDPAVAPVRVDAGQWDQVIMNLAVNARDAMTSGGRLTIVTRDVRIAAHDAIASARGVEPGRYVELSVSDTGAGMPPDVMTRIFEPFFTTKGVGHGTGLGLAVVYGIVRQSGGHIDVRSRVNAGTTFTILIPAVDAAVDSDSATPDAPHTRTNGSETILLVEDEDSLRRMAARVLTKQGYAVLQAASGTEALRVLEQHPGDIHLLVTDVVMPGMDGRELADRVRRRQPDIRMLFMSGYTEDAILHRGVEAARVAFLQKPYRPATLAGKIRAVLNSEVPAAM